MDLIKVDRAELRRAIVAYGRANEAAADAFRDPAISTADHMRATQACDAQQDVIERWLADVVDVKQLHAAIMAFADARAQQVAVEMELACTLGEDEEPVGMNLAAREQVRRTVRETYVALLQLLEISTEAITDNCPESA